MAEGRRKREDNAVDAEDASARSAGSAGSGTRARRTTHAPAERVSAARARAPEENFIKVRAPRDRARTAPEPAVATHESEPRPQLPLIETETPTSTTVDPWAVPQPIRDRFTQEGHRFYFPDGHLAFRDRGRRLTTPSENTEVIHSLVQIAKARGWEKITVGGTERFRQEAWRQARLAGLAVRGYRATEAENAQVMRRIAARGETSGDASERGVSPPSVPEAAAPSLPRSASSKEGEMIVGRLLEHGRASYRFDPKQEVSYFVRVHTEEGKREFWGKDLERALRESLTQPQIGDEIGLRRTGRDAVTVMRRERDGSGQVLSEKEIDTHRNRWVIETKAFFEQRANAAEVLRNPGIEPRQAVREHPELTGTYLTLRAAELAARGMRDPSDRERFVSLIRNTLADTIERGEPLQPVRIRERAAAERSAQRTPREREPPHVRE